VKKARQAPDQGTEEKIKAAARVVFHKKGYAATRTRDIAKEAGMNLALLNYYFKTKKHLFEIIVVETLAGFFKHMGQVFNDDETTLESKIEIMAGKYIDLISAEPEIPVFIMSEMRNNAGVLLEKLPVAKAILQSAFIRQYKRSVNKGLITEPNPLHFLMNLMGMIVFPFLNSIIIKKIGNLSNDQFDKLMQERKKRIPVWVKAMIKAK
jgi:AcrR family transcriptional regulator